MNPQVTQLIAAGAGLACTMVLVMTGKIDGPTAMQSISVMTSVFLGSQALTHGSTALSDAWKTKKQ